MGIIVTTSQDPCIDVHLKNIERMEICAMDHSKCSI